MLVDFLSILLVLGPSGSALATSQRAPPESGEKLEMAEKKELAKEEHDGYDSRYENLPVGLESRMLRHSADYS